MLNPFEIRNMEIIAKQKEKRIKIIVLLFSILFLLAASAFSQCFDRQNRYWDKPCVTTLSPCGNPLKFGEKNKKTDFYIGILADSINTHAYDVRIYIYVNENIDNPILEIGFPSDKTEFLKPIYSVKERGYYEYTLNINQIRKLRDNKFDFLAINTPKTWYPCANIKNNDFFYNFIRSL